MTFDEWLDRRYLGLVPFAYTDLDLEDAWEAGYAQAVREVVTENKETD